MTPPPLPPDVEGYPVAPNIHTAADDEPERDGWTEPVDHEMTARVWIPKEVEPGATWYIGLDEVPASPDRVDHARVQLDCSCGFSSAYPSQPTSVVPLWHIINDASRHMTGRPR